MIISTAIFIIIQIKMIIRDEIVGQEGQLLGKVRQRRGGMVALSLPMVFLIFGGFLAPFSAWFRDIAPFMGPRSRY